MQNIDCPNCRKGLQLPDQFAGQLVQCPHCQHTFTAAPTAYVAMPSPPQALPSQALPAGIPPVPRPVVREEVDDERYPRRRRRRDYHDDDDDDYDDRYRRRRDYLPHRGAAVLTLGILGIVLTPCGVIFGPIAWVMSATDLREIAQGRMDRTGEGITKAGQILGIVSTVLSGIVIGIYLLIFLAAAANGFR